MYFKFYDRISDFDGNFLELLLFIYYFWSIPMFE